MVTIVGLKPVKSQNTLQFSQVLTYTANNITACPYTIATVPADKVWKIEHMAATRGGYIPEFAFISGGTSSDGLYTYNANTDFYFYNQIPRGPIWLKTGDQIVLQSCSGAQVGKYFISIIEFSVVPN